jgi:hypothetical protein
MDWAGLGWASCVSLARLHSDVFLVWAGLVVWVGLLDWAELHSAWFLRCACLA